MIRSTQKEPTEMEQDKRKIFCWFVQWLNSNEHLKPMEFDLPQLTILLQALGFKLRGFEQSHSSSTDDDMISIDLTCGKSGMRSTLSKSSTTCRCPQAADVANSQFWNVTGCGPSSQENINVSTSSLLPTMTTVSAKTIATLMRGALSIIQKESETVTKTPVPDSPTNFKRSFSLDTFKTPSSLLREKGLKRQHSWEVDPRTSPPTETSSPIPDLCSSMSEVSIKSRDASSLIQNLKTIQKLIDDSITIASGAKDSTKYKRVSDVKPLDPPAQENAREEKISTPRRIVTPKKYKSSNMLHSKTIIVKNKAVGVPRPSPKVKKAAPTLVASRTPNSERPTTSRIASYVGLTPKLVYRVTKPGESNSSESISRFKNVVKTKSTIASYKQK